MKSILIRFPDRVVRYVRAKGCSGARFRKVTGIILKYGRACGWSRDTEEDFRGIGWGALQKWEDIGEISVEYDPDA